MSFLGRISFRTKLFAALILVILLTTILGYTLIHLAVDRAFHNFIVARARAQKEDLAYFVAHYLPRVNNEQELLRIIGQEPFSPIVADKSGRVITAPNAGVIGRVLTPNELSFGTKVTLADGTTWFLLPPRSAPLIRSSLEKRFLRTVTASLWIAGLIVFAIGLGIGFLLLRQLTDPLNRLATAARSLANRDFGRRVKVDTDDELGHLATAFNEMAASLERAERAKKRMIVDVSHELRNPLNVVRNGLEGLRDGVIAPTPENLAALHNKLLLIIRLVDDLHQLALADANQLPIHPAPVDLHQLIDGIGKVIGPELEDRGIRFSIRVMDSLPPVQVDEHRLEQVFLNLLANAARYTGSGGEIEVAVRRSGGLVETSVCNTGPKLTKEALEHVFDRFYRADPSRARENGGSGLGLAIAKAIITAHAGRIWAENAEHGTCFKFSLLL